MNEQTAAFEATFSDWKLVRSRKVVQLVFEVPVETSHLAYRVLGGMPSPAAEIWVAVARLDLKTIRQQQERADESTLNSGDTLRQPASVTGESPARVKSLYGERGGRRRNDAQYQAFIFDISHIILQNEEGVVAPMNPVERRKLVAELQHKWCRVASLADIMPGTQEELRFQLLETAFAADGHGLDPREIMARGEIMHGVK